MQQKLGAPARIACVSVPALALQLVLRAHPEWGSDPVVIVEDDRPLATIVWANRSARELCIHRGMSFAQAKALSARLHAEVVSEHALTQAIDALFDLLLPFSPSIEPVLSQPGLFWLDPRGLTTLFGDLSQWSTRVHAALAAERYVSSVVVGFERPSAFAIASVRSGPFVSRSLAEERALAGDVPLERLGISPRLQADMALLGIARVGELLALPGAQLRVRYGAEAARLHDFLSGKAWTPLLPRAPSEPMLLALEVDPPDDDSTRILFGLKSVLQAAADRLRTQHHAITALDLAFALERLEVRPERIESAAPTLDVPQLVDLLRLRLANVALPARVERIVITVEHVRVHPRQIAIETGKKPRDREAAARALARLRASFGPEAVTRARLCEAHLPEAAYCYEVFKGQVDAAPQAKRDPTPSLALNAELTLDHTAPALRGVAWLDPSLLPERMQRPLVRRVYAKPLPLPPRPTHEPEAWLGSGGAVVAMYGPHRIAGGWWLRRRERDYHFIELQNGELLWIFYDRPARRWFLHGVVD